jgi:ElaB/YqjD/DUF883 family membrane-anchored ribosome-binding protein
VDDERELEVIRHQMEGTRASLAEKLDALENQVVGTVQDATETVAETVEDVKSAVGTVTDKVGEAVESVKEAFNLSEHVRRHPWGMLGGAFATGFLGGWLLGPSRRQDEERATTGPYEPAPFHRPSEPEPEEDSGPSILEPIKGLAIGTLMGVLRHVVTGALPEAMKPDVVGIVDDLTTRIGGKPIGDVFGSNTGNGSSEAAGNGHTDAARAASEEPPASAGRRRARAGRR